MADPASKNDLKQRILENLGAPVININVSESQLNNMIDDALSFWQRHHYQGTERRYMSIQVTPTDIANGYLTLPDEVYSVSRVVSFLSSNATSWLSPQFHLTVDAILESASGSMVHYWIARDYVAMLEDALNARPLIEYQAYKDHRLYIHFDWNQIIAGHFILIECTAYIDPTTYTKVWSDRELRDLATAYVKRIWGTNLKKFQGIPLTGGVTMNGQALYEEGRAEAAEIEQRITRDNSFPPDFIVA